MSRETRLFIAFESEQESCADRLDDWPRTNSDFQAYAAREQVDPDLPESESHKALLIPQIRAANVTVCLISLTAFLNKWIAWEIEQSVQHPQRNGLVGILLHEFDAHPPGMKNQGAIFVPFKRDAVKRAIEWAATETYTSGDFTLRDL